MGQFSREILAVSDQILRRAAVEQVCRNSPVLRSISIFNYRAASSLGATHLNTMPQIHFLYGLYSSVSSLNFLAFTLFSHLNHSHHLVYDPHSVAHLGEDPPTARHLGGYRWHHTWTYCNG